MHNALNMWMPSLRGNALAPPLATSGSQPRQRLSRRSRTASQKVWAYVLCTYHTALSHHKPGHPESPSRLLSILERLQPISSHSMGTSCQPGNPPSSVIACQLPGVRLVPGQRTASPEELGLVHSPAYLAAIQAACGRLKEATMVDDSTYLSPGSYEECARSVGAVLELIDALMSPASAPPTSNTTPTGQSGALVAGLNSDVDSIPSRDRTPTGTLPDPVPLNPHATNYNAVLQLDSHTHGRSGPVRSSRAHSCMEAADARPHAGFALVRPPGHHVLPNRPMGFGVFNAVAIAAMYARQRYDISRILIVDFDVHHGNGTADIFYEDPNTLYISLHQAGLWPYMGKAREVGARPGRGATINIPVPGGCGDAAVRQVWNRVVSPAAERFAPELVLVSAGYDAHWRDPLAALQMHAGTYHWMCSQLRGLSERWCPGRLVAVLEGGYDGDSLAECVVASLEGLNGTSTTSIPLPGVRQLYEEPLERLERVLKVWGEGGRRTEGGGPDASRGAC